MKVKCEGYKNVSFPTPIGTFATKCNNGNFLNDGFEYLYNAGVMVLSRAYVVLLKAGAARGKKIPATK